MQGVSKCGDPYLEYRDNDGTEDSEAVHTSESIPDCVILLEGHPARCDK